MTITREENFVIRLMHNRYRVNSFVNRKVLYNF